MNDNYCQECEKLKIEIERLHEKYDHQFLTKESEKLKAIAVELSKLIEKEKEILRRFKSMKPLSQLLAEVEPIPSDRPEFEKILAISVEITRTLENIQSITREQFEGNPMYWAEMISGTATESLNAAARKMLGDDK